MLTANDQKTDLASLGDGARMEVSRFYTTRSKLLHSAPMSLNSPAMGSDCLFRFVLFLFLPSCSLAVPASLHVQV